jgi:uncharacterized protein YqjF (DUF2071 family)
MGPVFLTATWHRLVMLNFALDPRTLAPYLPRGTELDAWGGSTFASLVGFRFLHTRVKGVAVPFHRDFEEINLRFYVRRAAPEGWRRGVGFVREVVPRPAIARIAKWLYNENYVACPMRSTVTDPVPGGAGRFAYGWKFRGHWLSVAATVRGAPSVPAPGSQEEFITEHYWGYAAQRDGGTVEYRVEHPRWSVWTATEPTLLGDLAGFYGPAFAGALAAQPVSAFVADGSAVIVRSPQRL